MNSINSIIEKYIADTEYDISNSLGNCSFFARDVINWADKNGIKADYVYMPQSEEYRKENNISDNDWEDHIVPMINGTIIDFTMTDRGVSKNVRTSNTIPPKTYAFSKSLFEPNGIYGKLGYNKPEVNKVYNKPKNINSFKVVEPNKKKLEEAKKTDFSKEKSQGLHGWFSRRGGEGSQGWVDCNTCRKDPKTGTKKCKPCGRQDGEKRKYPACRPTPSACGTKGKGKNWGKKSNNENLNIVDMKEIIKHKLHQIVKEHEHESNNYMFFNNLKAIHEAITHIMNMDKGQIDAILSDGHGWALDHFATAADDIAEVHNFLEASIEHESGSYDGDTEGGYEDEYGSVENVMNEAEYKGKNVQLGKPTKGDVKKYKVFVKNKSGKVVKVNFGDPNMEIRRDNPERRKSFRARHKCSQAKDRTTPKYWSCRLWSRKPVSKIVGEDLSKKKSNIEENKSMTQPVVKPAVKPKEQPVVKPSRRDKPFLPEVAPGIRTDPKAKK